ncbi:MAG: type II toxin-antitoxin system VapC family toxin [Archangium sp.]
MRAGEPRSAAVRRQRDAALIVDSSAVVAILRGEADAEQLALAMEQSTTPLRMSAANYLEVTLAIDSQRDPIASRKLDELFEIAAIVIEPFTAKQAAIARQAWRDFGRGSGHRAGLNFGDCFAYALATELREPLLFKGDDFTHTDVRSALAK